MAAVVVVHTMPLMPPTHMHKVEMVALVVVLMVVNMVPQFGIYQVVQLPQDY